MEAADAAAGCEAGGADNARDGQGGQEGQEGQGGGLGHGLGGADAEAAVAGEAPRVPRPPHAPGPGGDALSTAGRPETRIHTFALGVAFPSQLEAEIACASFAPYRELCGCLVEQQLTVFGSVLAIRWRAENPFLLRISIINFLDQLCVVIRTMQRFLFPVPAKPALARGG
ncbi:EKC/KEOPS complex subunit LAGE3-like [Leopardus geoffroyi]|uniref:EKC/KEOPS complex subunit LAGE3-like n=1 Tax=Leopardus geoffroyi TaxID=46844 RepID=UPI001E26419D|nr:EKC/KEOPS complex subunit LAGE3-like [Leopardus geoffroyi]XP_045326530.1 EKC/KEOPS complex subunit LAGE3-like [Leopardus geoffroyi]XP_045326532.1 EKC/KEOPS complex subunit LAGE3-like [Leopardus geoffroyi]XP_045326533.1 EKC/KEOPS complex subunit LAGE3-like [Leopardus geoffroyi]